MKDFLHARPPFACTAVGQRLLQGIGEFPPGLCLWISRHPGHIGSKILPHIFEISEQLCSVAKDRVIADVARPDHRQNLWPNLRMEALIGLNLVRLDADHLTIPLHTLSFM